MRSEGGQIPTTIDEGIVLEIDDRVVSLRSPTLTQLTIFLLLLGFVITR